MVWAVKNYLEVITIAAASVFIFCYSSLMPHYNLNIDIMAQFVLGNMGTDDLDDMAAKPVGCHEGIDLRGFYFRRDDGSGSA